MRYGTVLGREEEGENMQHSVIREHRTLQRPASARRPIAKLLHGVSTHGVTAKFMRVLQNKI